MSQSEQLVRDSGHCRDHRNYPAALALCFEDSLRYVTNSFRCSHRRATVFLNYQAHISETNPNEARTAILFGVGYSSIARRTSFTVAAIGFNFFICPVITSGSFKPCPVTVQTIRLHSRIFRNGHTASAESHDLK